MAGTEGQDEQALVEAHLRRLNREDCATFVADLWEARGYETSREGTTVTARRGNESLRIAVGSDEASDILIALDGTPRTSGETRVIDAAGLAERLWYAVDRSVARDLCVAHLGAPPEALRPPLAMRLRDRLPPTPAMSLSVGAVILLAVLGIVALTGAGMPGSSVGEQPANTTLTATPDASDTATVGANGFPPGVNSAGIRDLDALAAAHERMVGDRPVTIWVDKQLPDYGDGWTVRNYDLDVTSNGVQYLVDIERGPRNNRTNLGALYHDGVSSYARIVQNRNVNYDIISPEQVQQSLVPVPSDLASQLVPRYLSTPSTEFVSTVQRDGRTLYRIVGTGDPNSPELGSVENYTATAEITASGYIKQLDVEYTVPEGDRRIRLNRQFTFARIDDTTVTTPAWYTERFAGNETATP